MRILITGISAAGKSTLYEELLQQGYDAYDIDADHQVAYSIDVRTGEKDVTVPKPRPRDWADNHHWIWDGENLKNYLETHAEHDLFVCGTGDNEMEFYGWFDKLFVLTLDMETLTHRLTTRTNNDYGQQPYELRATLDRYESFTATAIAHGALEISSMRPVKEVASDILRITYQSKQNTP